MKSIPRRNDSSSFDRKGSQSSRIKSSGISEAQTPGSRYPINNSPNLHDWIVKSPSMSQEAKTQPNESLQTPIKAQNSTLIDLGSEDDDFSDERTDSSHTQPSRMLRTFHQMSKRNSCDQSLIDRLFDVALLTTNERIYLSSLARDSSDTPESESNSSTTENASSGASNELLDGMWIDKETKSWLESFCMKDGLLIPAELMIFEYKSFK